MTYTYLADGTKVQNASYASVNENRYRYANKEEQSIGGAKLSLLDFGAVMDVQSLVSNIKNGNTKDAVIDGVGLAGDLAAAALPLIPGGAGAGIKAARAGDSPEKSQCVSSGCLLIGANDWSSFYNQIGKNGFKLILKRK